MTANQILQESEETGMQFKFTSEQVGSRNLRLFSIESKEGSTFWWRQWKDGVDAKDILRQGLRMMEWLDEGGKNIAGRVSDKFVGAMWGRMMVEERKAEAWKRERAAERVVGDVRSQASLHRLIREIERVRKDKLGLYEWLGEVLVRSYGLAD